MKRPAYIWIALAVATVVAIVAVAVALSSARKANPTGLGKASGKGYAVPEMAENRPVDEEILAGLEVEGPTVTQTDAEGNPLWTAESSGTFTFDEATETIVGRDVHWKLARGEEGLAVSASRMEFARSDSEKLSFAGDVVISAADGREFRAEKAVYETATEKVICEGRAEWEYKDYTGSADRLVIDLRARKVRFDGNVRLSRG